MLCQCTPYFEIGLLDFLHDVLRYFLLIEDLVVFMLEKVSWRCNSLDGVLAGRNTGLRARSPDETLVRFSVVVKTAHVSSHLVVVDQACFLVLEPEYIVN